MLKILFEAHSTTFDNEAALASGWNDVRLSPAGMDQAKELATRYLGEQVDAIFCSDLKRSQQTASIAFNLDPRRIYTDWRLRECDYGDMSGEPKATMEAQRLRHISEPFPHGESYQQCMARMASFLNDLKARWDSKTIVIIGHRATQYGLEHWLKGKTIEQCLSAQWQWEPGWTYELQ